MPIKLANPKVDPATGTQCDYAMADRLHITVIGGCSVRFTVFFGRVVDGVFEPMVEGGTFGVRNVEGRVETCLDAEGNPTVVEVPADNQFDSLCSQAHAQFVGQRAYDIISDLAIYPWLMAYVCPVSGTRPYAGEIV